MSADRFAARFTGGWTAALVAAVLVLGVADATPLAAQVGGSLHGPLPDSLDCSACHTGEAWTPVREPMDFVHDVSTDFPLTGAHAEVTCRTCHEGLRFDGLDASPDDCATCHLDVHAGALALDCASCHDTRSFQAVDGVTVHQRTTFPLTGAHLQVSCESCHLDDVGGAFTAVESDCAACHVADWERAETVDHEAAGYSLDCTECHGTLAWSDGVAFDHVEASGGFPLVSVHASLRCASCHVPGGGLVFPTPADADDCVACHQADYDGEHAGSGFPTTCLDCHAQDTWDDPDFDHGLTGFALVGAHDPLDCSSCHAPDGGGLVFPPPAGQDDCVACHQADFDDEHGGSTLPTTCLDCHTVDTWDDADLEDHAVTGFELLGAHAPLECSDCHADGGGLLFPDPAAQDDCVACHQADFDEEHPEDVFTTTCLDCHTVDTWEDALFDHGLTDFDLVGAHVPLECADCHADGGGLLFPEPTGQDDCAGCHQADYDEEHAGTVFPTTCLDCHTVDTWEDATFDHALTGFELLGAHVPLECTACHGEDGGLLFPEPAGQDDCVGCHQADYDDEHAGSVFPVTCLDCHTVETWEDADFDHALTGFSLLGAHAPLDCSFCHAPDNTLLFPEPAGQNDCVACHRADYDDEHGGSGFTTACLDCHTVDTWDDAFFDHGATGFDLVGAHAPLDCSFCHAPDNTLLFPAPTGQDDCVACHQADYDDEHAGSGFPVTCLDCHGTDDWDSTLDHDGNFFPIYSGRHAGEWSDCATCHVTPGDFAVFTCLECHEHSQANTDGQHGGVNDYVYESGACLSCHPDGRE